MGPIYNRQELHDPAIDPYGPMSGRNLVSIVSDDLGGDQLSEVDSYLMPGKEISKELPTAYYAIGNVYIYMPN